MAQQVVIIESHGPASESGGPEFKAVAFDEEAAKSWVQDEIDGKHGPVKYREKKASWFIKRGYFTFKSTPLHR